MDPLCGSRQPLPGRSNGVRGITVTVKRFGPRMVCERAHGKSLEEMLATVQGEPEGELPTGPAVGAEDFE